MPLPPTREDVERLRQLGMPEVAELLAGAVEAIEKADDGHAPELPAGVLDLRAAAARLRVDPLDYRIGHDPDPYALRGARVLFEDGGRRLERRVRLSYPEGHDGRWVLVLANEEAG